MPLKFSSNFILSYFETKNPTARRKVRPVDFFVCCGTDLNLNSVKMTLNEYNEQKNT